MKFSKAENIYGTAFYNGYVSASANDIIELTGISPQDYGDNKVSIEFRLKLEDDTIFAIYDWKEWCRPSNDTVVQYHIGTSNVEDTYKVVDILKQSGLNAYVEKLF